MAARSYPPVALGVFVALFVASLVGLLAVLWPFLADFVLAWMAVALCSPLQRRLRGRWPDRPRTVAGLLTALVAVVVLIPVGFVGLSLSAEAADLYQWSLHALSLEQLNAAFFGDNWLALRLRDAANALGTSWTPEVLLGWIGQTSGAVASFVSAKVNAVLSNLLAAAMHFVLLLLIAFVTFLDGARLLRYVLSTSPLADDDEALLIQAFHDVAHAIFVGNGLGSLIQGVFGGVAFAAVGLPSPVLWGTVMTVFAFLPLVGISLVTLPATLVLIVQERYLAATLFLLFNALQSLVVENVIKTRLIGSHMRVHDLLIFLSIVGGLAQFGVLGLIYGPLLVALFTTLAELYHRRYKWALLGTETQDLVASSQQPKP